MLKDLDLCAIYHEGCSGKIFVDGSSKVWKIGGACHNLTVFDDDGEPYVEDCVILAQFLGLAETVRTKLANKPSKARGVLHGKPVDGNRFSRQPHLKHMHQLIPFTGCEAISGPPNFTEEKALFEEEEEKTRKCGQWSPLEFKCLEMVDWKVKPGAGKEVDDEPEEDKEGDLNDDDDDGNGE